LKLARLGSMRNRIIIIALTGFMITTGYLGLNTYQNSGLPWRINNDLLNIFTSQLAWSAPNSGLCMIQFQINPCLQSLPKPTVLLLGDSHANSLYPGLVNAFPKSGFLNIGICGAFLDVASRLAEHDDGNNGCQMNASILENIRAIESLSSIKTVLITGLWRSSVDGEILTPKEKKYFGSLKHYSLRENEQGLSNRELIWAGLSRTINAILSQKKQIIFLRDVPVLPKDIRDLCVDRLSGKDKVLINCMLDKDRILKDRASEDWLVQKIQDAYPQVLIYDPLTNSELCSNSACFAAKDGIPFYRDQHHLSMAGSNVVGRDFKKQYDLLIN